MIGLGQNKKTIFISWFIGLGFGLFFSGIILSVLLYTSNKTSPGLRQEPNDISQDQNAETAKEVIVLEDKVKEEPAVEEVILPHETVEEDLKVPETITLHIKSEATAHDITKLLVENGIISDYDGFIAYIVSMDAERSLSHGTITFPLNSDIKTIFKILRP